MISYAFKITTPIALSFECEMLTEELSTGFSLKYKVGTLFLSLKTSISNKQSLNIPKAMAFA